MNAKIGGTTKIAAVRTELGQALGSYAGRLSFGLVAYRPSQGLELRRQRGLGEARRAYLRLPGQAARQDQAERPSPGRRRSQRRRQIRTGARTIRHRADRRRRRHLRRRYLLDRRGLEAEIARACTSTWSASPARQTTSNLWPASPKSLAAPWPSPPMRASSSKASPRCSTRSPRRSRRRRKPSPPRKHQRPAAPTCPAAGVVAAEPIDLDAQPRRRRATSEAPARPKTCRREPPPPNRSISANPLRSKPLPRRPRRSRAARRRCINPPRRSRTRRPQPPSRRRRRRARRRSNVVQSVPIAPPPPRLRPPSPPRSRPRPRRKFSFPVPSPSRRWSASKGPGCNRG